MTFNASVSSLVVKAEETKDHLVRNWMRYLTSSKTSSAISNIPNMVKMVVGQFMYPKRRLAHKVLVVFTDGSNNDVEKVKMAKRLAYDEGIKIIVVPVGYYINQEVVQHLASDDDHIVDYQKCRKEWHIIDDECEAYSRNVTQCVLQVVDLMCKCRCPPNGECTYLPYCDNPREIQPKAFLSRFREG